MSKENQPMTHSFFFDLHRYREYRANRDKRKRRIFSSKNEKNDLKTDSKRSFKPILYHQEKLELNSTLKVHEKMENRSPKGNMWSAIPVALL